MNNYEQQFYLFAETPRAGQWNHRFLVPFGHNVPDEILNYYGKLVREGKIGTDFVGVRQEVNQQVGTKTGYETLVLVTPNYNLSKSKSQIENKLRELQPQLAELVTKKINWDKNGTSLITAQSELTSWQHDLEPLLSLSKPKGWIMRHKFLFIVMVTIVFIVVCQWKNIAQTPRNIVDNLFSKHNNSSNQISPRVQHLQDWLHQLDGKNNAQIKDEKFLEKALRDKLVVAIGVESNDNFDLQEILNRINYYFGVVSESQTNQQMHDQKQKSNLEKLLADEKLRENIIKLYRNGQFNPLAFCTNQNDEVEATLSEIFNKTENKSNRIEVIRNVISSAIDVGQKSSDIKENGDEKWIRFAKSLSFMNDEKDVSKQWKVVTNYNPQWITKEDVQLSKIIFKWLMNDDANAVLEETLPSNYDEALRRFVKIKIDFETTNRSTLKIGETLQIIDNRKLLLDALKKLQNDAKESVAD
jgi:hypothetical protein